MGIIINQTGMDHIPSITKRNLTVSNKRIENQAASACLTQFYNYVILLLLKCHCKLVRLYQISFIICNQDVAIWVSERSVDAIRAITV